MIIQQLGLFQDKPLPCYHCNAMPTIVQQIGKIDMYCANCMYQGIYNSSLSMAEMIRTWNDTQISMRDSCMAYGRRNKK